MQIENPTYIVAELSKDAADWVYQTRSMIDPDNAFMPQEITLTGSSGIGSVIAGQKLSDVTAVLDKILDKLDTTEFEFLEISKFPGVPVYFAKPEPALFKQLHADVTSSTIQFEEHEFPYNPHCTIKAFTEVTQAHLDYLDKLNVPVGKHRIDKIAIYEKRDGKPVKIWERLLDS